MSALLLDTHVWLWLVTDNRERMSSRTWSQLDTLGQRNGLAVSDVSFWELALQASKGRLSMAPGTREWLKQAGRTPGVGVIQLDRDVLIRSTELDLPVRDPADRMIVATALQYDLTLATADHTLLEFANRDLQLSVFDVTI